MTAVAIRSAEPRGSRRPARRHLWFVPGFAVAVLASSEANGHGIGVGLVILFGILPHLPAWLGLARPGGRDGRGRLGPRTTAIFNAMHHPGLPVALAAVGAAGLPPIALVAGLTWLGHVLIDWGLGDGRRAADGTRSAPFIPSHLFSWSMPRSEGAERA